jgi:Bacterial TSP3 repeat
MSDFWDHLRQATADEPDDGPDPEAVKAQQELLARRDALLAARERLQDPWNQTPEGSDSIDPEAALTGVADAGHAFAEAVTGLGSHLSGLPGGDSIAVGAATVGRAVHGVADLRDRDGDGLSDGRERQLRTNRTKRDTDNDGLDDGVEVDTLKSNPRLQDSDRDGRSDFDEAEPSMTIDGDDVTFRPVSAINTPPNAEANLDEYIEPSFGTDDALPDSPDDDVQLIMNTPTSDTASVEADASWGEIETSEYAESRYVDDTEASAVEYPDHGSNDDSYDLA